MPDGRRGWAALALAWSAATALAIPTLDRPAALLAHDSLGGWRAGFVALTHLVDPLLPLAVCGFAALGGACLLGSRFGPAGRAALAVCVATLLAVALKDQLKLAFGRTWPETWVAGNPSLVRDGVMAWVPFHGGLGWSSFPSGHATLAAAPATAVMLVSRSRWRGLAPVPVALVSIGLFGADYHYVSDIMAGLLLGAVTAAAAVRLLAANPPPTA